MRGIRPIARGRGGEAAFGIFREAAFGILRVATTTLGDARRVSLGGDARGSSFRAGGGARSPRRGGARGGGASSPVFARGAREFRAASGGGFANGGPLADDAREVDVVRGVRLGEANAALALERARGLEQAVVQEETLGEDEDGARAVVGASREFLARLGRSGGRGVVVRRKGWAPRDENATTVTGTRMGGDETGGDAPCWSS